MAFNGWARVGRPPKTVAQEQPFATTQLFQIRNPLLACQLFSRRRKQAQRQIKLSFKISAMKLPSTCCVQLQPPIVLAPIPTVDGLSWMVVWCLCFRTCHCHFACRRLHRAVLFEVQSRRDSVLGELTVGSQN